jgi:hypothetical protein
MRANWKGGNSVKILKVQWKDGDVVTEQHLRGMESWAESTQAALAIQLGASGFMRVGRSDADFNDCSTIAVRNVQGTQYRVKIANFRGISGQGRIVSQIDPHEFELAFRTTERDSEGFWHIFLIPLDESGPGSASPEVTGGPVTYEPLCTAQTSDSQQEGLCIARLKVDGPSVSFDQAFLPLCLTLDASPQSIARFEQAAGQYQRLMTSVEEYMKAVAHRPGLEAIWAYSTQLFRFLSYSKPALLNVRQFSRDYFLAAEKLFTAIAGELKILGSEFKDPKLLGDIHATIESLSTPISTLALDRNMGKPYDAVTSGLEAIAHLLSRFPEGPAVEAALAVADILFSKGTAYNKLTVHFVEDVPYSKEESRLIFKFRDFATREPSTWDIRLALGADLPYGSLPQLNDLLRRVSAEEFDFRIDCPGSVMGSGKMRKLTLYLPPPLGENVDNLRGRVTVSLVT